MPATQKPISASLLKRGSCSDGTEPPRWYGMYGRVQSMASFFISSFIAVVWHSAYTRAQISHNCRRINTNMWQFLFLSLSSSRSFSVHSFSFFLFFASSPSLSSRCWAIVYSGIGHLLARSFRLLGGTGNRQSGNFLQPRIPDKQPFPCRTAGHRSRTVPTSVHQLRPGKFRLYHFSLPLSLSICGSTKKNYFFAAFALLYLPCEDRKKTGKKYNFTGHRVGVLLFLSGDGFIVLLFGYSNKCRPKSEETTTTTTTTNGEKKWNCNSTCNAHAQCTSSLRHNFFYFCKFQSPQRWFACRQFRINNNNKQPNIVTSFYFFCVSSNYKLCVAYASRKFFYIFFSFVFDFKSNLSHVVPHPIDDWLKQKRNIQAILTLSQLLAIH